MSTVISRRPVVGTASNGVSDSSQLIAWHTDDSNLPLSRRRWPCGTRIIPDPLRRTFSFLLSAPPEMDDGRDIEYVLSTTCA